MLLTCCLILIDRGLGSALKYYYFRISHGEQKRTTYAIDSCVASTVILGSSRAAHHYSSPVIAKILHTSCYNAGKDKQRLRYALAMLRMLFKRYTPKQIILDLNPTAFEANENGLDELSGLLPYYENHPEIRSIINQRNRFEWIKTYSDLYCYNSLPLKIIFNNLSNDRDDQETDGYVPLKFHKEIIPTIPGDLPASFSIDTNIINCFKSIVQLAKDHNSQLIVVVSPIYYKLPVNLKTLVIARVICEEANILFLDYSQSPIFISNGPEMFLDLDHLNDSSAIVFTKMLACDLKRVLKKN